jgi:hypothetical protein
VNDGCQFDGKLVLPHPYPGKLLKILRNFLCSLQNYGEWVYEHCHGSVIESVDTEQWFSLECTFFSLFYDMLLLVDQKILYDHRHVPVL